MTITVIDNTTGEVIVCTNKAEINACEERLKNHDCEIIKKK